MPHALACITYRPNPIPYIRSKKAIAFPDFKQKFYRILRNKLSKGMYIVFVTLFFFLSFLSFLGVLKVQDTCSVATVFAIIATERHLKI